MSGPRSLAVLVLAGGLSAAGCAEKSGTFLLLEFVQAGRTGVRLNEPLRLRFSAPVDPLSVGSIAAIVAAEDGTRARGEWRAAGTEVSFLPALPESASLGGAGLQPGQRYCLELSGRPRAGGVRSTAGAPLPETRRFFFATVAKEEIEGPFDAFVDLNPGEPPRLVAADERPLREIPIQGLILPRGGVLALDFSEPLHPATVEGREVVLQRVSPPARPAGAAEAVLVAAVAAGSRNRRVLLRPGRGLVPGERYNLVSEALGFADFGGNEIQSDFSHLSLSVGGAGAAESEPGRDR